MLKGILAQVHIESMYKEAFMRNYILLICIISLLIALPNHAQPQQQSNERKVAHPEIPRVSAYEAYGKYKEGKALIFHGGGELYNRRHILVAYNLDVEESLMDKILVKFPKQGIEIFTYCY
jgi:hypothetical protein